MRPTVWGIVCCIDLAVVTVVLSGLDEGKPAVSTTAYRDPTAGVWKLSGVVRFPRGGNVHALWWCKPIAVREAPFQLELPGEVANSQEY